MKKQVKMISTMLVVLMMVLSVATVVSATSTAISGAITGMKSDTVNQNVTDFGGKIVTVLQTVGIVVAVVVMLVIGIKYMIGSAEEKAEYKKTMIPYIVGAVIVFAATTIVNIVYQLSTSLTQG